MYNNTFLLSTAQQYDTKSHPHAIQFLYTKGSYLDHFIPQ